MKKGEIRKIMEDFRVGRNNIEGIFNYCDYWCERCAFTSRCTNYQMGKMLNENAGINDISNKEYWEHMGNLLAATFEFLREKMAEMGYEVNKKLTEEETEAMERSDEEVEKEPVVVKARAYLQAYHEWHEANIAAIDARNENLRVAGAGDVSQIDDALSVTTWYSTLIPAKLFRASLQALTDDHTEIYDSNGSARVALSGIERSLSAFTVLIEQLPEYEDDILNFMIMLSTLRTMLLARFPGALSFHRPGFDD